jgi:hypothetical protein
VLWCVLVGETALRIDAGGFCQVSGRLARREAAPSDVTKPGRTAGQHGPIIVEEPCRGAAADRMPVRVPTYRNRPTASRQVMAALPVCVQRSATYRLKRTLPLQISGALRPTH